MVVMMIPVRWWDSLVGLAGGFGWQELGGKTKKTAGSEPGGLGEVVSTSGYVDLVARCRVAHLVHIVGTAKMPSNAETAGAPVALACRAT
jgi:hypothetical protein